MLGKKDEIKALNAYIAYIETIQVKAYEAHRQLLEAGTLGKTCEFLAHDL